MLYQAFRYTIIVPELFPKQQFLERTKFKAFAYDKLNVAGIMIFVSDRVRNIVGKGESAGYQHFLLFPQCFRKAFFKGCQAP